MKLYYPSPIGIIELEGDEKGLRNCSFVKKKKDRMEPGVRLTAQSAPDPLREALEQIDDYFKDQRQEFSVRLNLKGTEFQKKVWRCLQEIPFGQTSSYRAIAEACGHPGAFRAVGGANHQNPVVIIVPCHRVIGSDGSLVGFGAGLWRKKWLLEHEHKRSSSSSQIKK